MNMPEKIEVVTLPKVMDLGAAKRLAADLLALRGKPVALDASHVQRVGGLCLQVLLSARRTWAADKTAFGIVNPAAAFEKCMAQLGAFGFTHEEAA
jgi:chemotaxis protein CheX